MGVCGLRSRASAGLLSYYQYMTVIGPRSLMSHRLFLLLVVKRNTAERVFVMSSLAVVEAQR
jgi:hypothetical protein